MNLSEEPEEILGLVLNYRPRQFRFVLPSLTALFLIVLDWILLVYNEIVQ